VSAIALNIPDPSYLEMTI